ncbi:thioesterase-like superfamily-domain-containing protein [Aspergillus granulosus]|uniref:Thioesterase-like superfamily-domain-containing protein n=1 Tax=Aspergillus granulosus TaxID=176169 RepID=A0ABR4H3L9_9EURO
MAADSSAILSSDRRAQVRRAQRTYRQKKEAVFRGATARAEQLESKLRAAVEELSKLSKVAAETQLHLSHPEIHAGLRHLCRTLAECGDGEAIAEPDSPSTEPSPDSSSEHQKPPVFNMQVQSPEQYRDRLTPHLQVGQYTYAFQESRFARQLQRYCLEQAYQLLFTETPQADPREIYRVFRLVPCVQDRGKTEPYFRRLLTGGCTDSLELLGLPFYKVGGAGTHFPDVDVEGNAVYPVNSRMPRRILGILPCAGMEDKLADQALVAYGLGGEWFDCRDVEGYLRQQGVDVNQGLFPALQGFSPAADEGNTISYILDVTEFFSRLVSGLVILGRAPGFRKTDVRLSATSSWSGHCDTEDTDRMPSLNKQIAVERVGADCYHSIVPPIRMGELAGWAYGGNILAIAVSAAYATATPGQHLYSISGHFVRAASPSQKLICRVERIRDTRTFQTRHLRVFQCEDDTEQLCLIATAEFHIDEPAHAVMVNYSARPQLAVPSAPADTAEPEKTREPCLYSILDTMMDIRPHSNCADREEAGKGVSNIVAAERFRVHEGALLQHEADRIAALAFYMDRGLAYIPANHSGYSLAQASACATLDFALRLLTHQVDLQNWLVSERQTCGAGNARALSEGRVFNADGLLLATMTQTTILRAKKGTSKI